MKDRSELWFPLLGTSMSYIECLSELSDEDVFRGLLGFGMFAEQIPPLFSSEVFFEYCQKHKPKFNTKYADYVTYEGNRHNLKSRIFGIPNPFVYYNLCLEIKKSWKNILDYFDAVTKNHNYKLSRVHVRKFENQHYIFMMNYKSWKKDDSPETDLLIGSKFIFKADISSCFSSIYTHAIPWAVIGKTLSKQMSELKKLKDRRKQFPQHIWLDELDSKVRNTTNKETTGILIGPHSSNLISEILLTRIDKELFEKGYIFVRSIDDYTCYAVSKEEGEKFIFDLNSLLTEYKLKINDGKTDDKTLPQYYEDNWINRLNVEKPVPSVFLNKKKLKDGRFKIVRKGNGLITYKQLRQYLDLVVSLLEEKSNDLAILKYVIKTFRAKHLTENAKVLFQRFFLKMAFLYPYLLPSLDKYLFVRFKVDHKIIDRFSNKCFQDLAEKKNMEGIAYIIFFGIKYNFTIQGVDTNFVVNNSDCIVKTLGALYLKERNDSDFDKIYDDALTIYGLKEKREKYWLYYYTVLNEDDLTGDWKTIKHAGVSFIK